MVSLICCYNNAEEYESMIRSLRLQDTAYELIGIDNRDGAFLSAAAALNHGAAEASGDILVFLHQDIRFRNPDSLSKAAEAVRYMGDCLAGPYGASHADRKDAGHGLKYVETLDECFVAMPRSVWEDFRFDETVCDGWHLYVVELCLRVNRVLPVVQGDFGIEHLSGGNVDEAYMKKFRELLVLYRDRGWITTTCKSLPANTAAFFCYHAVWKIKKALFKNMPLMYFLKRGKDRDIL